MLHDGLSVRCHFAFFFPCSSIRQASCPFYSPLQSCKPAHHHGRYEAVNSRISPFKIQLYPRSHTMSKKKKSRNTAKSSKSGTSNAHSSEGDGATARSSDGTAARNSSSPTSNKIISGLKDIKCLSTKDLRPPTKRNDRAKRLAA